MKRNIKLFITSTIKISAVLIFISTCTINQSIAQVVVPATIPEKIVFPIGLLWLNTAVIDYKPNCTSPKCSSVAQLQVVTGTNTAVGSTNYVTVDDGVAVPINIPLPAGAAEADVVVGNCMSPNNCYLVGVIYKLNPAQVVLNIYIIFNVGTGIPLLYNIASSQTLSTTSSIYHVPRIDIIAEHGNSFLGLPLCNKFAATWVEDVSSSTTSIVGYYSSLNAPSVNTRTTIINTSGIKYTFPDVAGVQRNNGSFTDVALFTYTDVNSTGNSIYYQEWDMTNNIISSQSILENTTSSLNPRIAAIDDYNINDPATTTLAYYTVVAEHYYPYIHGGYYGGVRTYNNLLPTGGLEIASPYFLPTTQGTIIQPGITNGPCTNYTITYGPSAIYYFGVYSQVVDWNTGYPVGYDPILPNPFTNVNYYQMNLLPASCGAYAMGTSSTCNGASPNYAPYTLMAWDDSDNSRYVTQVYDKLTGCNLVFKTAEVKEVSAADWRIYPNPAMDNVTLTNSGYSAGYTYGIVDVIGKTILHANVTSQQQQVDISLLEPGIYMVGVYNGNKLIKTMKLVKQ